jgi:hypothetical protein
VLGARDLTEVEVLLGLAEREQVVVEGLHTVRSMLLRASFAEDHH